MRTKVSQFCEGIVEVGWLLAVIVAPLFFNVYSSRVFEPDKLSLVRSLATFMLAATLVHWLEGALAPKMERADGEAPRDAGLRRVWRIPLVVPALLLALVYLLSTITSVVPRTSFWGSYQRLQGTYSMLSYLVVFFVMLRHLRRKAQLDRLLLAIILTSVPISLYGLLQHYGLDPLPWGGDVTARVASHMGNPIFVAAYIILVIPVTLGQILSTQVEALAPVTRRWRLMVQALFGLVLLLIIWTWALLGFGRGLLMGVLGVLLFALIAIYLRRPVAPFLLLGSYLLILAAQVTMLIFSQSRGPLLGIVAGLFVFGLLYAFVRRWRKVLLATVAGSLALLAFLVVVNLPNTPLPGFRQIPFIGRLGQVFEVSEGTGKVRVLIWQGDVEMIRANPLRALIGYGPESMYVAYNPYYPPELAHYEARNASPDRSHNETFDALITTGVMGLALYMVLFGLTLYHGLDWLGLVRFRWQRRFFALCAGVGVLGGIAGSLILDHGSWRFAGVGIPVGYVAGMAVYLAISALWLLFRRPDTSVRPSGEAHRELLLVALLSAIVAHFVEINFGIAIAATRTYFWTYAALMVLLGLRLLPLGVSAEQQPIAEAATAPADVPRSRRKRKSTARSARAASRAPAARVAAARTFAPDQWTQLVLGGGIVAAVMVTLAWTYTTNSLALSNPLEILATAMTTLASAQQAEQISLGILWIALGTMALGVLLTVAQVATEEEEGHSATWWLVALGIVIAMAGGIGGVFALSHAGRLTPGANVPNLIYGYVSAVGLLWLALAAFLYARSGRPATLARGWVALLYPLLFVACLLVVDGANARIVKADVIYKQGLRYDRSAEWDNALHYYQQAVDAAPGEDYYWLFYGRAFMERAKVEEDQTRRGTYFQEALRSLSQARELNPLNTDHTANLARINRTWAEYETEPTSRREKLDEALALYEQATVLSPRNAQLWNEWGLALGMVGDTEAALARLAHSLELDARYDQTYLIMGEIYLQRQDWAQVVAVHQEVLELNPGLVQAWSTLGYAYSQLKEWDQAIAANEKVLELAPNDYGTLKNMAILYQQAGKNDVALTFARRALELAPEKDRGSLQAFVEKIEAQQSK